MRTRTARRAAVVAFVVLVLATMSAGAAPAGGQSPDDCAPISPFAVYDSDPSTPDGPDVEAQFAFGYFNTQLSSQPDNVDSDADGAQDQIDNPSPDLGVTSGRGTVRFRHEGQVLWAGGVGDIDGEPGDEIGVWATSPGPGDRAIYPNITEAWIVPGATPPGDVDPAVVGTSVGTGLPSFTVDRDGDSVPDVIVVDYETDDLLRGASYVLSGAAIVAAGPGGTVPGAPMPGGPSGSPPSSLLLSLPGVVVGFARLDAAADDLEGIDSVYRRDGDIVTLDLDPQQSVVTLRLARGAVPTTYVATLDPPPVRPLGSPVVFAYQGVGTDYLTFSYNRPDGLAATVWWEVAECTPAAVPPAPEPTGPTSRPPAAGPAVPVSSAARFTG